MDVIVKVLLEKETLERDEFEALMEGASIGVRPREGEPDSAAPSAPATTADEKLERKTETQPRFEPGVA